jgi:hypothetical protein
MLSQTPSTDGRGAFQDPSSVAFYNENSFMYLTQQALHDAIPELASRWQVSHLRTFFPTPGHLDRAAHFCAEGPARGVVLTLLTSKVAGFHNGLGSLRLLEMRGCRG